MMQPGSRTALATLQERLDSITGVGGSVGVDSTSVAELAGDLFSVVGVLDDEVGLRRLLADPATEPERRRALAGDLFGGRVGALAADLLGGAVAARWSRPSDLVEGLEQLSWRAAFVAAEANGESDEVEDELFRFGRVLAGQPELGTLLQDTQVPAERRLALLREVVGDRLRPVSSRLLDSLVRHPRRRPLDQTLERVAESAAQRRGRSIADVRVAEQLSAQQQDRLRTALERIYQRPISLKVNLDPGVLGGVVVRVGDEVIDGSIVSRLDRAARSMPR